VDVAEEPIELLGLERLQELLADARITRRLLERQPLALAHLPQGGADAERGSLHVRLPSRPHAS
jgi:hypothetical protein